MNSKKAFLESLYKKDGKLQASRVVAEAKKAGSGTAIYDYFEWDNVKAGDKYRLWQARQLIRVTKIHVEGQEQEVVHVPAAKVEGERVGEGVYLPTTVIVRQPDMLDRALDELKSHIDAVSASMTRLIEAMKAKDKAA